MKKYFLPLLFPLCLLLAACASKRQEPPPEPDPLPQLNAPTFYLDKLPDLPAYAGLAGEISARYGQEAYVDILRPAADYGRLYPYVGKVLLDYFFEGSTMRYGLVDAQGRIVVDPVYSLVDFSTDGPQAGAGYLSLCYPLDENDAEAQKIAQETDFFNQRRYFQFAKADGTWVSPLYYGNGAVLCGERVFVSMDSDIPEEVWRGSGRTYQIYDLEANLLGEGEGYIYGFCEDLSVLQRLRAENGEYAYSYSYIGKNGRIAIAGPFSSAGNFRNGTAAVALENDTLFAVIDRQGNYLVEPKRIGDRVYISENNDYFPFWDHDLEGLIDRRGNIVMPALYKSVMYYGPEYGSLLAAQKPDQTYDIVDFRTGQSEPADINFTYINIERDNWMIAQVQDLAKGTYPPPDQYLLRGAERHAFLAAEYGRVNLYYAANDIFAVNEDNEGHYGVRFYDANSGEMIKTWPGWNCYGYEQTPQGLIYYLEAAYTQKYLPLDENFEPLFTAENMAGAEDFREIRYLPDHDIFRVRTDRYSGLMRWDGSWLIRVTPRYQD